MVIDYELVRYYVYSVRKKLVNIYLGQKIEFNFTYACNTL